MKRYLVTPGYIITEHEEELGKQFIEDNDELQILFTDDSNPVFPLEERAKVYSVVLNNRDLGIDSMVEYDLDDGSLEFEDLLLNKIITDNKDLIPGKEFTVHYVPLFPKQKDLSGLPEWVTVVDVYKDIVSFGKEHVEEIERIVSEEMVLSFPSIVNKACGETPNDIRIVNTVVVPFQKTEDGLVLYAQHRLDFKQGNEFMEVNMDASVNKIVGAVSSVLECDYRDYFLDYVDVDGFRTRVIMIELGDGIDELNERLLGSKYIWVERSAYLTKVNDAVASLSSTLGAWVVSYINNYYDGLDYARKKGLI